MHLGIGAFARAHTAVFTEDAMLATGEREWGITAVTQRSDTVARQLAPQDGLFAVAERGAGARPARIVSSVTEVLAGRRSPSTVVDRIASAALVTLTVTEKGYRIDPATGGLDRRDVDVRADLAGSDPVTPIGQIVRGLQQRMRADAGPIAIVSCDNLPTNGALTRRLVHDFVQSLPSAEGAALQDWIETGAMFPSTMVDRMVPASTEDDLAAIQEEIGFRDEGGVVAEPFRQWVIEDFAGRRPSWESAGAQFAANVEPWESAKLRLLNASHSLLAYLGLAAGYRTIADSVADPAFHLAAARMMADDALPTIRVPDELDAQEYTASVLRRFANPALGHTNAKVGADGSQKLGLRLLSTVQAALVAGRQPRWAALGVAAWLHRVANAETVDDPLAGELRALVPVDRSARSVVPALLRFSKVFPPELAADPRFTELLVPWYDALERHGVDGLRKEISA
ncbi:mannitol dehydrogenase family protein [Microbacteriaceae bacterium VKM Ac-2855]|nr:mannitol dehydrogenase family protein [Microbacteriaceae bacterium VKM Ac-2855]